MVLEKHPAGPGLFDLLHRIIGLQPGQDAARVAIDVGITELLRPHGAVVAAGALGETAVENQLTALVRAKQRQRES